MKKLIYDFLSRGSFHFDSFQAKQFQIDPKAVPKDLISDLKNQKIASRILSQLNQRQPDGCKILRRYTIIHWCLIHQPSLCEIFIDFNFKVQSGDEWLDKNILCYYARFLQKISTSQQYYAKTKPNGVIEFSFQVLFYIINLLKQLFLTVKRISSLARYYKQAEKERYKFLLSDFVYTNAYHAQELYTKFKIILGEVIRFPEKYISNMNQKIMLKYLLEDELIKLNEDMKNLFLDKYFFPYGKGYIVKLLKLQDLTNQTKDFVDDLLFNMPARPKKQKKVTLDSILFDESGKLNPQVVHSLAQIRLGDESMRSNLQLSFRSHRQARRSNEQMIEQV